MSVEENQVSRTALGAAFMRGYHALYDSSPYATLLTLHHQQLRMSLRCKFTTKSCVFVRIDLAVSDPLSASLFAANSDISIVKKYTGRTTPSSLTVYEGVMFPVAIE